CRNRCDTPFPGGVAEPSEAQSGRQRHSWHTVNGHDTKAAPLYLQRLRRSGTDQSNQARVSRRRNLRHGWRIGRSFCSCRRGAGDPRYRLSRPGLPCPYIGFANLCEAVGLATFPDGSVIYGPLQQHPPSPDATALNPTVLLEVTSDSSEEYDTTF